jgi:hypothetical protein
VRHRQVKRLLPVQFALGQVLTPGRTDSTGNLKAEPALTVRLGVTVFGSLAWPTALQVTQAAGAGLVEPPQPSHCQWRWRALIELLLVCSVQGSSTVQIHS